MKRNLKNAISVLIVTAFTALAVFGAVQLTGHVVGTGSATTAYATTVGSTSAAAYGTYASTGSASGTLTCPRTGCTASYCHAAR